MGARLDGIQEAAGSSPAHLHSVSLGRLDLHVARPRPGVRTLSGVGPRAENSPVGHVAQLAAQHLDMVKVAGSSPAVPMLENGDDLSTLR